MRSMVLTSAFWLYVAAGLPMAAPPDLTQPLPGRLRAGYMSVGNLKLIATMQEVGMNAALVKFGNIERPLADADRTGLLAFARRCGEHDIAFLPVVNLWGGHEEVWVKDWIRYVGKEGVEYPKTPCPNDPRFWDQCLTTRFAGMAEALRGENLGGVLLDVEMYGADFTVYQGPCYCEPCLARFLAAQGRTEAILPAAERATWLKDAGLEQAYWDFQAEEVQRLATICREALHQVNPRLRIGVLHLDWESPFLHGLARGLGTAALPAICLTERTYASGHDSYVTQAQQRFRELGGYVDLLCGVWHSKFPAANVSEHYYHLAKDSWGYWVYTLETFDEPDYSPLPGKHEDYWAAIRRANDELDKLGADPSYVSPLKVRPFETPLLPLTASGFKPLDLVPYGREERPGDHPRLRGTNYLYLHAQAGEAIDFEISFCQIGQYREVGQLLLVQPGGQEVARAEIRPQQPGAAHATAATTGLYGLIVATGSNACEVSRASHPYAVRAEGKGGAAFISKVPALYLLPTPGATDVVLWLQTEGVGESVQATIKTDSGEQLFSGPVIGPKKLDLALPAGTEYLVASFEKAPAAVVMEDLEVGIESGLYPFAATSPAGLLTDR